MEATSLRKVKPYFTAGLRIDNGSNQPLAIEIIELVFNDYSSSIMCAFDDLDKDYNPIVVPNDVWTALSIPPGRSISLSLLGFSTGHEGVIPKYMEVKCQTANYRVELP